MKTWKILNSILVFAFVLAVLWLGSILIRTADERTAEYTGLSTESTGTESVTTYRFDDGVLIGRVSPLSVGADDDAGNSLEGRFSALLVNQWDRSIKVRGMKAISRGTGETLRKFDFSFEKATVAPGQQYTFSGAVPVSPEFFNTKVRKYDVALRIATSEGALDLPLEIYTLEVEPAMAAGVLKTNHVSFGEAEGTINFMNCEQASPEQFCEEMLERMGAASAR